MLTKARAKTKKKLSSLCPKKSIMNSPRRPLFSEIKYHIYRTNSLEACYSLNHCSNYLKIHQIFQ